MTRDSLYEFLGRAWCMRARRMARQASTYQAARNLRKQGIGLGTALALLTGRII